MELAYSPPVLLPPTAPLRLTPKSPRTPSSPTPFSSKTTHISPTPVTSIPSASVRRATSNPGRAPTPMLAKRMKSTSVLQQMGAFPCEGNRTVVTREGPIMTPKVRQGHAGGKLGGRLSGLVSLPKGRATNSVESGIRIDISTSYHSSSKPKKSPSRLEASTEDSLSSPSTPRAMSPTPNRRRWPFASGSFWPRASHAAHPKAPDSPRSSSDSSFSSEEAFSVVEKKPVLPRRGILKNKEIPFHQRSISAPISTCPAPANPPNPPLNPLLSPTKGRVAFVTDDQPVINVTLPARDSNPPDITEDEPRGEAERERAISELLEGLFMLSSGGDGSSPVSLSTIHERLDVPQIAIEEEEDGYDIPEVVSRGRSSLETSGVDLDLLDTPQISTHRLSTSAPSVFTKSLPWTAEEVQVDRTLQTKRSSCTLAQTNRDIHGATVVTQVTQMPSPPATPVPENISPIEEELEDDIFDIRDIHPSWDGKLEVSTLSDDQWTLRAESINEESLGRKSDGNLPRYSALVYSPTKALFHQEDALIYQFVVEEKPKPETSLIDENFTLDPALSESTTTVRNPPARYTSLALPAARRQRPVLLTDLLVERASQQWDREKVTDDVLKVSQRLRWDKAQKAWHLVREAEDAPVGRGQIASASQDSIVPRNVLSPPQPTVVARAAMLPPGRMEWATVDSASPDATGQPGLVFRLCIAWRLATQYNAINHPFGAQEEVKVFVLGRTHKEFYQFYEGLMGRFMLEPRRHPWTQSEEVGPRARAALSPMEPPSEDEEFDSTIHGDELTRVRKVDMLETWTQGFMRLKGTKMGFVLESDYVRMWMAPRREGDCERSADDWRKDGHGEIGRDSEGIARVLERLW